jgi:hypothetical protein
MNHSKDRAGPWSGCLRLLIVVEPAAQQIHGGFPNLGLRFPLQGHIARLRNPLLGELGLQDRQAIEGRS